MAIVRCPTCGKPFDTTVTVAMPFCSKRCQEIDLGRWLGEAYSLPSEGDDQPDEPPELDDD